MTNRPLRLVTREDSAHEANEMQLSARLKTASSGVDESNIRCPICTLKKAQCAWLDAVLDKRDPGYHARTLAPPTIESMRPLGEVIIIADNKGGMMPVVPMDTAQSVITLRSRIIMAAQAALIEQRGQ